jgi:hypothetical protein
MDMMKQAVLLTLLLLAATPAAHATCTMILGDEAGRPLARVRCGDDLPDITWAVAWIEDGGRISPFAFTRETQPHEDVVLVPRVSVTAAEEADVASIIVFTPDGERPAGAVAFRRWMKPGETVDVPAGRLFAISFDEKERPNGVASMGTVGAGKTRELRFDRSDHLVVELRRPAHDIATKDDLGLIELELADHERAAPSGRSTGAERTFLVWDGRIGEADVRIASSRYFLRQSAVRSSRGVTGVRESLEPLPALKVKVTVDPFDALPADQVIEVTLTDGPTTLRTLDLRPNSEVDVEAMPLAILDAKATMGDLHFDRRVDLTNGADGTVTFALEPLIVEGTVRYGGEPAEGEVAFSAGDHYAAKVKTEDGRYRATLWDKHHYGVVVTLDEARDLPPFADMLSVYESRTFDIDVPRSTIRVTVLDAQSDAPIADAWVYAKNSWVTPEGERRGIAKTFRTDAGGLSILPPLRVGNVELTASAEGYERSEAVTVGVTASDRGAPVSLRLKKQGATDSVRVVLPTGAPAAGAGFSLVSEDMQQGLASGTTDERGEAKVPAGARGVLLLRHPQAGGVAQLWSGADMSPIQMPPRTGRQLFRVLRPNGDKAPSARIHLLLNGFVISDRGLSFLAGSPAASGPDGVWLADGLPPGPLKATATTPRGPSRISPRELDSFAPILRPDTPIVTID